MQSLGRASSLLLFAVLVVFLLPVEASALVLSGRVLDPLGQPAADVDIDLYDLDARQLVGVTGDLTDAFGQFSVDAPAGNYEVRFKPPAGVRWVPTRETPVALSADLDLGDILLEEGWLLTGTVHDHTGAPLPDADLDLYDAATGAPLFTVRDDTLADGTFLLVVACGTYDVRVEPPPGHPDASTLLEDVFVDCADLDLGVITLPLGAVLEGTVYLADSGLPVEGADLDLYDAATGELVPTSRDDTDATGFYSVTIPEGTYHVEVEPPTGSRGLPARREDVAVTGTVTLDFPLESGVFLSGTVTAAVDASPVADVDIDVIDAATGDRVPAPGSVTDAAGTYIATLPPGTYEVRFLPPAGSTLLPHTAAGMDVSSDTVLDASLDEGFRLVGRVLAAADASPVAGVDLDVRDAGGTTLLTPHDDTLADGTFTLIVPTATGYRVDVDPPGPYVARSIEPVDVTADPTDLGDLLLEEGVEVVGRVLRASDTTPVEGVDLDFTEASLGRIRTPDDDTGTDGRFRVWVPEGTYAVDLDPGVERPLTPLRLTGQAMAFPGPVDLGDLLLEDAALLTGRVVEAGTGAPIASVDLDLLDAGGGVLYTPGDDTASDGRFALRVPPGDWTLDLEPAPGDPWVARRTPISVSLPETDLGDVPLEPAAFLTGRVLEADTGQPVVGADLDLYDASGTLVDTRDDDTDGQGRFSLRVAPLSGGRLVVTPPAGAGLLDLFLDPVDVQAPETDLGDLLLETAVTLSGTVRDAGGQPVAGVDIDVYETATGNLVPTSDDRTASDGTYSILLPAGTFDVEAKAPRGTNLAWGRVPGFVLTAPSGTLDFDLTPLLVGVAPISGPTAGGTVVTVTADRAAEIREVSFLGAGTRDLTLLDPTTLTAPTPFHVDGTGAVEARYGTGEWGYLADAFTYVAPADPPLLLVDRVGPDVLLTWNDTGAGIYTAARGREPDLSDAVILVRDAVTQTWDTAAVGEGGLVFYSVE